MRLSLKRRLSFVHAILQSLLLYETHYATNLKCLTLGLQNHVQVSATLQLHAASIHINQTTILYFHFSIWTSPGVPTPTELFMLRVCVCECVCEHERESVASSPVAPLSSISTAPSSSLFIIFFRPCPHLFLFRLPFFLISHLSLSSNISFTHPSPFLISLQSSISPYTHFPTSLKHTHYISTKSHTNTSLFLYCHAP